MSKRIAFSFEELGRAQVKTKRQIDWGRVTQDFQTAEPAEPAKATKRVRQNQLAREMISEAIERQWPSQKEPTFADLFMKKESES